ncbi:glutamyl-tRNA reductase [Natronobacillus azotifigens]|uniref:Glutamyl-tRNA reductase n=1 Tax=Natronobacillus azotifigens TaxID=472978 RepID=A0A9J6RAT1_9BACI|nr:glutamyl-tRNA reductase [Natronobacillus azotifigens]MCZ0702420.1 glutamyl-tRNA reductase [Natronobacillus azotifigens]
MNILMIGIDYHTAPIEIREQCALDQASISKALQQVKQKSYIKENVILSTCNRTEIYLVVESFDMVCEKMETIMNEWFSLPIEKLSNYFVIYKNEEVISHLFRVASGLDSMVLGETQIIGQVKQAFEMAKQEQSCGWIFNQLFKQAITMAKKAHKDTGIADHPVSLSYVAVKFLQDYLGKLAGKKVLILGAGKMGTLAATNVEKFGLKELAILNRNYEKAKELAKTVSGVAYPIEQLTERLKCMDIVISTFSVDTPIITEKMLDNISFQQKNKKLIMMDLSLPRSIDPNLRHFNQIDLYDIDQIHEMIDDSFANRKKAAKEIEQVIQKEVVLFQEWRKIQQIAPTLAAMQAKANQIEQETMTSIQHKLSHLSAHDQKVIQKHIKSVSNQWLKEPIRNLKQLAIKSQHKETTKIVKQIMGLDEIE